MDSSSSPKSPKSSSCKSCSPKSPSSNSSSSSSSKSCYPAIDSEGVLIPSIHQHLMMPVKASKIMKWCDCCERSQFNTDGYECRRGYFYVHKSCAESSESIQHPSHPGHTLLRQDADLQETSLDCNLCGWTIRKLFYHCDICEDFNMHLFCAMDPPPEVIDVSDMHHHKLTLLKKKIKFRCDTCGNSDCYRFPYKCEGCDLAFHMYCVWHPSDLQLNHSHHLLHPLKPYALPVPVYSDGKCTLCGQCDDSDMIFHCPPCNFTLCMSCVSNPPPISLLNLKAHEHELTLLPRVDNFTCIACGLKGDRSPYACFQCGFIIHQECVDLPRVININRHDHRVSRSSILGFVKSVCGICRKKVDWSRGGFSSQKCRGYVVHSKCATRKDVWNGEELEEVPEEIEDVEPYLVIDDNTIQHFSHTEHPLKLHVNEVLCDDNKRCRACTHPICLQSFYACDVCDFILHQHCAGFLRKKRHFLHNDRLTLVTDEVSLFLCDACDRFGNGFRYEDGIVTLDVLCASICEPFVHPSHRGHPLYYTSPDESKLCNACNCETKGAVLRCIEDDCEYVLCFKCATIPLVIKHRVDDHLLSLCYGENAIGKYWCDICEKETDPKNWFYTCKDQRATLHTKCVFGDFTNFMPGKPKDGGAMLNNSVSRPICFNCKLHCIYPIMFLIDSESDEYYCSWECLE